MERRLEGLGLGLIAFSLILPLTTWYKFYSIPDFIAVLETPMYLVTMMLPFLIGIRLMFTNLWLGVVVCYSVMNVVLRPNTLNMQVVIWFATGALIIEIVRLYVTHKYDYYIQMGFGALGIFQSIYAIQQWMGYDFIWFGHLHNKGYIHGTFGNPNYLGVFQVLCLSFAPLKLIPFILPGLFLSKAVLAIGAFVVVMMFRLRNFWISYFVLSIGFGLAGAEMLFRLVTGTTIFWKGSWSERLAIWWLSLDDVSKSSPAFGFGLGGYFERAPKLQSDSGLLKQFMEFFAQAHNEYVQFYYESGIVGLTLLIVLLYTFRRHLLKPPMIGIAITSFGMFPFHIMTLAIPACVLIGLSLRDDK